MENRDKFKTSIDSALGVMNDANDNVYLKGEFFGYFVNRLVRRFLATQDYTSPAFNSSFFNESKKKALDNAADSVAAMFTRSDPIVAAADLNWVISSVYLQFLESDANKSHDESMNYGIRAYFNGVLDKIVSNIETVSVGGQKEVTMAFRRHLVIRGVLDHVKARTRK